MDSETKADTVIIILMVAYGIGVVSYSPIMAIAGWLVGGLLVLRHTVEPFGEFVEEKRTVFMLILLAIWSIAFLLAW